ncbi:hypothetical protein OsI_16431 [Oryza sativa Indica Group]|jgi:hypothetical protein|nr:hypothetical protein OsI_16431 [Oryza sativa Indica Group]
MASGGVRLRRRGFVLCAVDHHGVRRAVVGGQFVRKSELRRQDELLVSLHELVGVFRELQRKLGFRQWDEFRRAQPELDVLYQQAALPGQAVQEPHLWRAHARFRRRRARRSSGSPHW